MILLVRTCARLINCTHAHEMAVGNFMILAIFLLLNVSSFCLVTPIFQLHFQFFQLHFNHCCGMRFGVVLDITQIGNKKSATQVFA